MFQFTAPLGLTALGTLLVPLVIHLVRKPLRTVRLGDLRFLGAEKLNVRSVRWRDRLLLALRCGLLSALALSLAGLHWQPTAKPARLVLLVPGATLDAAAQAEWDRLRANGFTPRALSPGFPTDASPRPMPHEELNAWSLLRELDARSSAGSRAYVFGPAYAHYFTGPRPTLSRLEVTWITPRVPPTTEKNSPARAPSDRPVRVAIVADSTRSDDSRYVRAALEATGLVEFSETNPDWIVQLGGEPADAAASKQTGLIRIIADAPANVSATSVDRWFDSDGTRLTLRQRVALKRSSASTVELVDSAGEPLLVETRHGSTRHWQFAFRFHSDWSDWPLTGAFPAWWRDRLRPAGNDTRAVTSEMAAPRFDAAATTVVTPLPGVAPVDLRPWCWVLAVLLFVAERWLSRRTAADIRP